MTERTAYPGRRGQSHRCRCSGMRVSLRRMNDWVVALGGTLEIDSPPGGGTRGSNHAGGVGHSGLATSQTLHPVGFERSSKRCPLSPNSFRGTRWTG
jgi:hypothetical protein